MERWVGFALKDLRRNLRRLLVSATAFILGIALMTTLLIVAAGGTGVGLAELTGAPNASGAELVLRRTTYPLLFQQIFGQDELEEMGRMRGVRWIIPFTELPAFFVWNLTSPATPIPRFVLTDSFQDLEMVSGRLPMTVNEIVVSTSISSVAPHLAGIKVGDVVSFQATNRWGESVEGRPIDGQEFTVTGLCNQPVSQVFEYAIAFGWRNPYIPISSILVAFSNQEDLVAAYRELATRYDDMPVFFDSDLVRQEKSVEMRRRWSFFLVLVSGAATAIGSVTLVNGFQYLSFVRRREIGIMRSVGATRRQILVLFFEHLAAVILFFIIGLVVGMLVGGGANTLIFRRYAPEYLYSHGLYAMFPLTWDALVYPALIALAIGLVASMIPSIRASRMEPVEVLRHGE
jgi:ABC-type antimicrobial peptide transport system permease subunit